MRMVAAFVAVVVIWSVFAGRARQTSRTPSRGPLNDLFLLPESPPPFQSKPDPGAESRPARTQHTMPSTASRVQGHGAQRMHPPESSRSNSSSHNTLDSQTNDYSFSRRGGKPQLPLGLDELDAALGSVFDESPPRPVRFSDLSDFALDRQRRAREQAEVRQSRHFYLVMFLRRCAVHTMP